jgi:hypothetical protein
LNPLNNSKGLSILFLITVMLMMIGMGYILTYLIPTKHKTAAFSLSSTQAYFIAQSGVEFAVRYASDRGWRTPAQLNHLNGLTRNLGNGRFILSYESSSDRLTSIGEVQNMGQRRILISNFTQFVSSGTLILDPDRPFPCQTTSLIGKQTVTLVNFYIKNISPSSITLNSFQSTWVQDPPTRHIASISIEGRPVFAGNYHNGEAASHFNIPPFQFSINSGQSVRISVVFTRIVTNLRSLTITFYTPNGESFIFNLDPEGDGLPEC